MMSRYLKVVHHPSWEGIQKAEIEKLSLRWRTVKEDRKETGVFAMRHLETYKAEPLHKWKSGLFKECSRQPSLLHNLRLKYTAKILLSDINTKRDEVIQQSEKFHSLNDNEKGNAYDASTRSRIARMKNFRLFGI